MSATRPIKEFCECGSGIQLVGLDDKNDGALLKVWRAIHSGYGHEDRVTAPEASAIRHAATRALPKSQR
jgi:hypothetical protein